MTVLCYCINHGVWPRGDWGDGPPKVWGGGTAHASVLPIFWEVVLSDARESTNRVKKGVIKKFFSEIVVFLVKKGSYTTFNTAKIRKIWKKKGKIRKPGRWLKKVIRNFGRENGNILGKNVIQKSWSAKNVSVPPNSAPGLRHSIYLPQSSVSVLRPIPIVGMAGLCN